MGNLNIFNINHCKKYLIGAFFIVGFTSNAMAGYLEQNCSEANFCNLKQNCSASTTSTGFNFCNTESTFVALTSSNVYPANQNYLEIGANVYYCGNMPAEIKKAARNPGWNTKTIGDMTIYACSSNVLMQTEPTLACALDWANAPTSRQYVYNFGGGAQAALQIPGKPTQITYSSGKCTAQCPLASGGVAECSWTQGQLQNLPSSPSIFSKPATNKPSGSGWGI